MIHVSVTAEDIAEGIAGDCQRCALALALSRATKDNEATVSERDWTLHLRVWGRSITAPGEAREFVNAFDGQPRDEDNRIDTAHPDYEPMEPFDFDLPDQGEPEWQEDCSGCEGLFDPSELDGEGYCPKCREKSKE